MPGKLQVERLALIDPSIYPGWDSLLAGHSESSFFHTAGWARVLKETYGHQPYYFCRFSQRQLQSVLPIMEVYSCLAGRRGVSLPFSDFCPSLNASHSFPKELVAAAIEQGRTNHWRYLEFRNAIPEQTGVVPSMSFYGHIINLESSTEQIFGRFTDSVRRGIRKAEKAGLRVEFDSDLKSIKTFYSLHSRTRQRHGLPPQPFRFFANIAKRVLETERGFVVTAILKNQPVASSVFFHHNRQTIYKFGASDLVFQQMRPNNIVMWEAIKYCISRGMGELHLGRTSLANDGLRRFKLGFGSREEKINYFKFSFAKNVFVGDTDRATTWVNSVFRKLPLSLLRFVGARLYPHLS